MKLCSICKKNPAVVFVSRSDGTKMINEGYCLPCAIKSNITPVNQLAEQFGLGGTFAPLASYDMVELAVNAAKAIGVNYKVGNILSSDVFYNATEGYNLKWKRMGILGVEMEAAALYMNAAYAGKRALAICTVSDHIIKGESLDSDARATSFTDMMKVALETAIKIQSL